MSIVGILPMLLLYYTLYLIIQSHRIKKEELLSVNSLILYMIIIASYFFINASHIVIPIASLIFSLKILQKSPLLMLPLDFANGFQILFMLYLLFSIINQLIFNSLIISEHIFFNLSLKVLN